jgi:hypothetical protein
MKNVAPAAGNLCGNRGQNKAQGSRWFRARLKYRKFEQQNCPKNQVTIVIAVHVYSNDG